MGKGLSGAPDLSLLTNAVNKHTCTENRQMQVNSLNLRLQATVHALHTSVIQF